MFENEARYGEACDALRELDSTMSLIDEKGRERATLAEEKALNRLVRVVSEIRRTFPNHSEATSAFENSVSALLEWKQSRLGEPISTDLMMALFKAKQPFVQAILDAQPLYPRTYSERYLREPFSGQP
jgi:hypothetical protein